MLWGTRWKTHLHFLRGFPSSALRPSHKNNSLPAFVCSAGSQGMTHIPSAALKPQLWAFPDQPQSCAPPQSPVSLLGQYPFITPTEKLRQNPVLRFLHFYLLASRTWFSLGLSFSICKMGSRSQLYLDSRASRRLKGPRAVSGNW